jgi:23S rRNA pseudouridine2605 synthase
MLRINKYLSLCGIGSRRKIETLLKDGLISVNGKPAEVGMMIDEETDKVYLKERYLKPVSNNFLYIALNKPKGYVSTVSDEMGRKTVMNLVNTDTRLYPVGRLDKESTGLIILTNDGNFALKLTHPKYHLPKKYIVETKEYVTDEKIKKLASGIEIDNKKTLPADVKKLRNNKFEITLYQGLKRQIREMCKILDLKVVSLHRIAIGNLLIGSLKFGEYRNLTKEEVDMLLSLT